MFKKTMLDRIQRYKRTVPVLPCSALISNLLSSNYEIRIYNEPLKFSRLIGPPDTWVLSQLFRFGSEESIYGRLFKNNMDGLNSFGKNKDQLDKLVKSDSLALIQNMPTHNFEEYHCKVTSVWKANTLLFTKSWFMSKTSTLSPFIANGLRKMVERGVWNNKFKRHIIAKPNCKPLRATGQSLGMEKFASLFAFYIIGLTISLILLVLENIFRPAKPAYLGHSHENLRKVRIFKEVLKTLTDNQYLKLYLLDEVKSNLLHEIRSQV